MSAGKVSSNFRFRLSSFLSFRPSQDRTKDGRCKAWGKGQPMSGKYFSPGFQERLHIWIACDSLVWGCGSSAGRLDAAVCLHAAHPSFKLFLICSVTQISVKFCLWACKVQSPNASREGGKLAKQPTLWLDMEAEPGYSPEYCSGGRGRCWKTHSTYS